MIHPHSSWKRFWDLLILLVITYFALEVPFRLVFPNFGSLHVSTAERIFQVLFAIDIIIQFRTGVIVDRVLVQNPKWIAKSYLKSWFIIDFLSAFPFDLFGSFFYEILGVTDGLKILRLVRSVRIFELFRSLKLIAVGGNHESTFRILDVINPVSFRLLFFVYWTSLFAHWIACGWIYLTPEFLASSDTLTRYIRALYWSVTTLTTIGYGDITPKTNIQTIYTMGVMILGVAMYGYVIGNIASLLSNLDISRAHFQEKLNMVNSFLRYKKIPLPLANRIRAYYINMWEYKHGMEESEIWDQLPNALRIDLALFLHGHLISVVPFLKTAPEELKREIVLELKPSFFMKGDIIFREGDIPHHMYFISKGQVSVVREPSGEHLATLSAGSFFGEMALIDDSQRTATVYANSYCDLYTLNKDRFWEILKHHPNFADHIRSMATERKKERGLYPKEP